MIVLYRMMIVDASMNTLAAQLELGVSKKSHASCRQRCVVSSTWVSKLGSPSSTRHQQNPYTN
jgi:hypothetical protein